MPITKQQRKHDPLWKEWDRTANKTGQRHTIYSVNGDQYTGEWENNLKHGKGTQYWKRKEEIYDGDWKESKRHGFGTFSKLFDNGKFMKVYSGGWKSDKRHGYGTNFYPSSERYEGEWHQGQRSGWGKMYYDDGSVFEGEWANDMREGTGVLKLCNGNRYEGAWSKDLKNGKGKLYFLDKGQLMIGTWQNGILKCGTLEDYAREIAPNPTQYPIPECTLEDSECVLDQAEKNLKLI